MVGTDDETDIAVLKIKADNLEHRFPGWKIHRRWEVGDFVLAISNPLDVGIR